MIITIATGTGVGKTLLSAFDSSLKDAGVYNYNLITLSSVIPPGTVIKQKKYVTPENEHGHKLYVVKAEMRSRESKEYIGAVVGWYQLPDGKGVFVEHETIGETKHIVESTLTKEVQDSLSDLCINRKYPLPKGGFNMKLQVAKVDNSPTSVLVIAVYKSEGWE